MEKSAIETIKASYPKIISKDQLYRICHISKKTALYLLESGAIPSVNSGKKTRKYKIRLDDVITFLQEREINPLAFKPPENYYRGTNVVGSLRRRIFIPQELMPEAQTFFENQFRKYKEVLTTAEVNKATGYSQKTIIDWYEKKEIKCFLIKNKLYFPKEYLIDFLLSERCNGILRKSKLHITLLENLLSTR